MVVSCLVSAFFIRPSLQFLSSLLVGFWVLFFKPGHRSLVFCGVSPATHPLQMPFEFCSRHCLFPVILPLASQGLFSFLVHFFCHSPLSSSFLEPMCQYHSCFLLFYSLNFLAVQSLGRTSLRKSRCLLSCLVGTFLLICLPPSTQHPALYALSLSFFFWPSAKELIAKSVDPGHTPTPVAHTVPHLGMRGSRG